MREGWPTILCQNNEKYRMESGIEMQNLRIRKVLPEEVLSEEDVLKTDAHLSFIEEPERTYSILWSRMRPVFQKEGKYTPLLVETPQGRGIWWRWWSSEIGVVLILSPSGDVV